MTTEKKPGGVIRVQKRERFTIIDNDMLRDKRLSFGARGLHAHLLSRPNNWQTNVEDLVNQSPAGEHAVRSLIAELKAFGYMVRTKKRRPNGTTYWETLVYETPELNDQPVSENPQVDKPQVDEPQLDEPEVDQPQVENHPPKKEQVPGVVPTEEKLNEERVFANANTSTVDGEKSDSKSSDKAEKSAQLPKPLDAKAARINEIWIAYPRKTGKRAALEAIEMAINRLKTGKDAPDEPSELLPKRASDWLLERTRLYAKLRDGGDEQFTPHPATWFKQGRFCDSPSTWEAQTQREKEKRGQGNATNRASNGGESNAPVPARVNYQDQRLRQHIQRRGILPPNG